VEVENTLAYCNMPTMIVEKGFRVQAPGGGYYKEFYGYNLQLYQ